MNQFEKDALDTHNLYRACHHAPPLSWNNSLAREAQAWAERLAREDRLKHASTDDGENIYMSFGDIDVTGGVAVDKWYDEVKEYNFSRPGFQSNTGHFTQVVWRGSKELGVGCARGYDGKVFVVARYRPAGNNLRTFEENVLPGQNHYPVHSSGDNGWNHPEVNGDSSMDPVLNYTAWKNHDRWDPIYTAEGRKSPSRGRESSRNTPNRGRESNRDTTNRGMEPNKDISKRGREENYILQEPRKTSWEPKQNGVRHYHPSTTQNSGGVGQNKFVDHKWDSGKWFDEELIEPTVNTAQHSSPERKILKDSTNFKDVKKTKSKGIVNRWQPQGNENQRRDNRTHIERKGHYEGSVDRNKSANKVRVSTEKWESTTTNDDLDGRDDVKVGRNRTRESIKRWEQQRFNQPHLPFQHPRPSLNMTMNPTSRPTRSSQQQPIKATQSSQVQAAAERWDPLWGDKPLNEHKPRPVSWDSSRFANDKVDSDERRPFNEPKKITTTIGDGPIKTVVSSITIVLKGNEGRYSASKARSKSTDDLRRLDRPKSSYTSERRQPVQEVYAEQRTSKTNTRPKSEDFTSRAIDDWESKRLVKEEYTKQRVNKTNTRPKSHDLTSRAFDFWGSKQPVREEYAAHRDNRTNTRPQSEVFTSRAIDDWEPKRPVKEEYAVQRVNATNTKPQLEDYTSRAFDGRKTKRPVDEDNIVPEIKTSGNIYDTTDSYHGNRDDRARTQFPSLDQFSQQALDCHNIYRALHDASNLMWSPQIAAEAQAWAERLARERILKHSTRERGADGENLAMFSGNFENAAREATDMWYDEAENYDFSRPGYQPRSGHFTQLVWKGSKEFGMGRAQTSDGQLTIVVARYRPPGNVIRNYELNVFPKHSFF